MANPLHKFKLLLVDADLQLAQVLRSMLHEMGFQNVHTERNAQSAFRVLNEDKIDFVITEWNTQGMSGVEFINAIRRDPYSKHPTLPIVMLTGRAESMDVIEARDAGVNEYVVKPFTSKTVYSRLQRIIEQPKPFVISKSFIGPGRRSKGVPPAGKQERRIRTVTPSAAPKTFSGGFVPGDPPRVWAPDKTLQHKLGVNSSLGTLITPSVLSKAQSAIEALTDESLLWIKKDLQLLLSLCDAIEAGKVEQAGDLCDLALLVNSRAGTFGYVRASEVAYMLYLFCRNRFRPEKTIHITIARQHINVLRVMIGKELSGDGGSSGNDIIRELRALTQKYAA